MRPPRRYVRPFLQYTAGKTKLKQNSLVVASNYFKCHAFKNQSTCKNIMETTVQKNYTRQMQRLLGLISDSHKNYLYAIDHTKADDLKDLFRDQAAKRESIMSELRSRIEHTGGNPEEHDHSFLSQMERSWEGFKASISGKGDQEILERCRNTDQAVLDGYDDVLQGNILQNADLKTFLAAQRLVVNESFTELDRRYFNLFKTDPSL